MRKKHILEQIETVTGNNSRLYRKNEELTAALKEAEDTVLSLKAEIKALTDENSALRTELETLKENSEVVKFPVFDSTDSSDIKPEESNIEIIVGLCSDAKSDTAEDNTEADTAVAADLPKAPVIETELLEGQAVDIASKSIGRIVLKCAEACNVFMKAGDANSKDLINLALGRSEVFKSEALALVKEELSRERLTAELNAKEAEVTEYFELLLQQI